MTLATLQQSLTRACLEPTLPDDALAQLDGDNARWALYRAMVRQRFVDTIGESLPRSSKALGPEALDLAVARWLNDSPPTTRYMRELGVQYARYLESHPESLPPDAPPWTLDLVRYEAAVMEAVIEMDPAPRADLAPLAMERPVALSVTQRFIRLGWSVHRDGPPTGGAFAAVVYRGTDDSLQTLELTPSAADIYEAMREPGSTLESSVHRALARRGIAPDPAFLEGLAGLLAELIERGLILGSTAP